MQWRGVSCAQQGGHLRYGDNSSPCLKWKSQFGTGLLYGVVRLPLKMAPVFPKIPANGIHRADHHRTHQLPLELSELFLRVRVSIRGEGSENLSFLIPAKSQDVRWGERTTDDTPPPSAHLRLILREHKIFPATQESCRIYIGTCS